MFKKYTRIIVVVCMSLAMMLTMSACRNNDDKSSKDGSNDKNVAAAEDNNDGSKDSEESKDDKQDNANPNDKANGPADGAKIIDTIDNIDAEDDKKNLPIMISAINLYDDGSVEIIPNRELKEIELRDSERSAIYPFEEFGKAKKIYLMNYGNAGYRTILALMDDGTIAAVNARALVEDHIIAVAPHITGRDDFKTVKNYNDESGSRIVGVTKEGKEIDLDNSLNLQ